MSSNVPHRVYWLCSQVVLHQQGCNFERLQLRDLAFAAAAQVLLWAATASYHLGYLDTLDAKHLDNTRHPLDPLDPLDTLDTTPRHLDTDKHGPSLDRPRQASTGLDRPRQASTPLSLDSSSTAARHRVKSPFCPDLVSFLPKHI